MRIRLQPLICKWWGHNKDPSRDTLQSFRNRILHRPRPHRCRKCGSPPTVQIKTDKNGKKMRLVYRKRPKRLLRHITRCCCCWGGLESNKKVKGNGATSFLASPQHKDRYCQELAIHLLASADCNRSTRQNLLGFFSVYITLLVYTFSLSLSLELSKETRPFPPYCPWW
jgi:hypothetical protein